MNFTKPIICALFWTLLLLVPLGASESQSANGEKISGPHFTDMIVTTSDTDLLFFGELKNSLTTEMIDGQRHTGVTCGLPQAVTQL